MKTTRLHDTAGLQAQLHDTVMNRGIKFLFCVFVYEHKINKAWTRDHRNGRFLVQRETQRMGCKAITRLT